MSRPGITRYDTPADAQYINTYVPLPFGELLQMKAYDDEVKAKATESLGSFNKVASSVSAASPDVPGWNQYVETNYNQQAQAIYDEYQKGTLSAPMATSRINQLVSKFGMDPAVKGTMERKKQEDINTAAKLQSWEKQNPTQQKVYNQWQNELQGFNYENPSDPANQTSLIYDWQNFADLRPKLEDRLAKMEPTVRKSEWFDKEGNIRSSENARLFGQDLMTALNIPGASYKQDRGELYGTVTLDPNTTPEQFMKGSGELLSGKEIKGIMFEAEDEATSRGYTPGTKEWEAARNESWRTRVSSELTSLINSRIVYKHGTGVERAPSDDSDGSGGKTYTTPAPSVVKTPVPVDNKEVEDIHSSYDTARKIYTNTPTELSKPSGSYSPTKQPFKNAWQAETELKIDLDKLKTAKTKEERYKVMSTLQNKYGVRWNDWETAKENKAYKEKYTYDQLKSTLQDWYDEQRDDNKDMNTIKVEKHNKYKGVAKALKLENETGGLKSPNQFLNIAEKIETKQAEINVAQFIPTTGTAKTMGEMLGRSLIIQGEKNLYPMDKNFHYDLGDAVTVKEVSNSAVSKDKKSKGINARTLSLFPNNPNVPEGMPSATLAVVAADGTQYAIDPGILSTGAKGTLTFIGEVNKTFNDYSGEQTKEIYSKPDQNVALPVIGASGQVEYRYYPIKAEVTIVADPNSELGVTSEIKLFYSPDGKNYKPYKKTGISEQQFNQLMYEALLSDYNKPDSQY